MTKRWPLNETYFWERVPFFRALIPLVAGIILYPPASGFIKQYVYLFAAVPTLSVVLLFLKQKNNIARMAGFAAVQLGMVCMAFVLCHYYDIRNDNRWFGKYPDCDAFVAKVTSAPLEKEKTWRLEVAVTHAVDNGKVTAVKGDALVYLYKFGAPVVREGDEIMLPAKWQAVKNRGNPYEFDYVSYLARRNVYLQQFLNGKNVTVVSFGDEQLSWMRQVHHWCLRQLEWYITDRATLGLMKAMLMNDTHMLDEDVEQAYADTGIVHVIAISGGHIGVFFVLIAGLLAWLRHRKYRWVKYMAAIPLIWIYVLVAGAPPSAVRAAAMFSILGIGFALQKSPNGINQLLATAFLLLCANPMWLYDIGFQLSFIAVLSIMIFYRPVYSWISPVNKILCALWSAMAVSIAAEILVAPLVIYYFHLFPLQFIVANLLAWLFMGVVLVLGLVLIAVSPLHSVAKFIGTVTEWLVTWFNKIVYQLQALNFESFSRLRLNEVQLLLVYLCIISLCVFFIKKHKAALFTGLSAACVFLLLCCVNQWNVLQQQQLIVYNTPKGNYIELINGRRAILLNAPDSIDERVANRTLLPAHINMQVAEEKQQNGNVIKMGGHTVFIMWQPISGTVLHADYVIVDYPARKRDILQWQPVFGNAKFVLTNAVNRKTAAALPLKAHVIRDDGAFILNNN